MIERYTLTSNSNQLINQFSLDPENEVTNVYNAFPTKLLPVITNDTPNGLSYFYWGQTPTWGNKKKLSSKYFNVPRNQLFSKTTYKNAAIKSRCIIPITGFYSWRKLGKKTSVPYYYFNPEHQILAVAGIWEEYSDFDQNTYHIFNMVVSSDSNQEIDTPLFLTKNNWESWLSKDTNQQKLEELTKENSNISLASHTVSPLIGRTDVDDQTLIAHQPPSDQHGNYTLFD